MKLTSEALRELYQKETARIGASECLPAEMLASAAAGELSDRERKVVADHLASCSSCAKEYREIRTLKSWAESKAESLASSTTEVAAGPTRVLRLPERPLAVAQPPARSAGSRLASLYIPLALAALFLIVALVLGAQLIRQRWENDRLVAQVNEKELATAEATRRAVEAEAARRTAQEELARRAAEEKPTPPPTPEAGVANQNRVDQPLVNVPIFELEPRDSTRGSGTDVVTLEATSDTRLITLILHVNGELSHDAYSLEVLNAGGKPVWSSRNLRQNRFGNFTVALPRQTFPAGDYRLKLYSLREGRRQLVEEYAMRLQYR